MLKKQQKIKLKIYDYDKRKNILKLKLLKYNVYCEHFYKLKEK